MSDGMEDIKLENKEKDLTEIKGKLQEELENYTSSKVTFVSYLETMEKINLWLNTGEFNENN